MPFLNDDELTSLHKTVDKAEKELKESQEELNLTRKQLQYAQTNLKKHNNNLDEIKKSKIIISSILGLLLILALGLAYYFYSSKGSNDIDIKQVKQTEATRVLDSITALGYFTNETENDDAATETESLNESINSFKENISGEKIYSVQIGAFSRNKFPLLSESLTGFTSKKELFKYSIGLFETLEEAQNFRKELVLVGFEDSFVASYIGNQRQEIEEAN